MNATQLQSTLTSPAKVTAMALAIAAAVAVVSGCASSPSPAPTLLSLPPALASGAVTAVAEAPAATGAASPKLLAIRRVGIPEYLVARRVRYRSDASTLAEWPNTYWAERIEIGVSREFISALRQQLPGWELCESTCGDREPSLALQVDMVPMDFVRSAQQLQARARITVSSAGASPRTLQTTESTFAIPAAADTAQAQAGAVTELLRRVASATAPLVAAAQK